MRLLVFGDLHLDAAFAWARPDAARRRRQALRDTLLRILALADEVDAQALLCVGDLYEQERFTPDTREFLRTTLGDAGRPVLIAPGNHDWYGAQSLYSQVDWPETVHIFSSDRFEPYEIEPGLTIWGSAHRAPRHTPGFFDSGFAVDREGLHLGLFHGAERAGLPGESRGKEPHAPFDAAQITAAGMVHAFVGHYHQPRDETQFTYPGNPEPLAFGEEGKRGAVVAEIGDDGQLARRRVVVATSEMHDLRLDVGGCGSLHDVQQLLRERLQGMAGMARVTLEGEVAEGVDMRLGDLEGVAHDLDGLVLRLGAVRSAYDIDSLAAEPTVRGRFVQRVLAAEELDDDERRRVLVTGLRAFAGRDDLEVP